MPYDKHCHCTPKQDKFCPICSRYKVVFYFKHRFVKTYGTKEVWHSHFSKNNDPRQPICDRMIRKIKEHYPKNVIFQFQFYDKESNQVIYRETNL